MENRMADPAAYLSDLRQLLNEQWPRNRTVNIVCHGHSVPAGYFDTPNVRTLGAYPHLLLRELKSAYPYAVVNVIVTAIGGEHSAGGAERFESDVLRLRPDVVTIDYALNDRSIGLAEAERAWRSMIEKALAAGVKTILLTPTWDHSMYRDELKAEREQLLAHTQQIRKLAAEYGVGLADSFAAFEREARHTHPSELLSWSNHPNERGHELVARELARWFEPEAERSSPR